MIRAKQLIKPQRHFSTLLSKAPETLHPSDLTHPSINQEDEEGRLKLIQSLHDSQHPDKPSLYAHLIPNFSYYFKIPKSAIQDEILHRLINVNPGRVHSTLELYNLHRAEIQDYMVRDVLKKMASEEEQGEGQGLDSVIGIVREYEHLQLDEVLIELFYKFIDEGEYRLIDELINSGVFLGEILLGQLSGDLSSTPRKFAFLGVFHKLFNANPEVINTGQYAVALNLLSFNNAELHEITTKTTQLSFTELTSEVLNHINTTELDITPESVALRQTIIEVYGISQNDTDNALKKYHYYESHAKADIDRVRFEMIKVFAYQAIKQDSAMWNQVAQTFIPAQFTIETLQVLIVLKSYFDVNEAMEIYNAYINEVGGNVNETTRRSAKGLLTESIILGFLLNNDREFASLIFEKAVESGIIADELEIAHVKKMFKKYSDAFVENEEWEGHAQLKVKEVALEYLVNIGGMRVLSV
ncbi:MIOREX complex component 12 [Candida viswanathii]|uniref:MIOREX complex component 12 n=1 Tax=Candida viswanathii TaxID=5486 RepID=A0A367XS06_9ASCO|nr:MIOREX complex component 12 [Candida viswanathii]